MPSAEFTQQLSELDELFARSQTAELEELEEIVVSYDEGLDEATSQLALCRTNSASGFMNPADKAVARGRLRDLQKRLNESGQQLKKLEAEVIRQKVISVRAAGGGASGRTRHSSLLP